MKHIVLLLLLAVTFGANAQSTSYRFSNRPGNNSYSFINYNHLSIADTGGSTTDTIGIRPFTANSIYNLTLTDSCQIRFASKAGTYKGDIIQVNYTKGTGAGVLYFSTDFVVSTGTNRITITASKKGIFIFQFDGTKYVEINRNINY